ncbi:dopamine N-acetyltransferase-like isoform X1 [Anopheles stephensi]|uniref:dopamine N-acetyltransferase-like isoform X1 n=1 Tax=Anopheles stephensi TaxID=30069 RepID=UPI0016588645|nr:dopamine N-acetyltransferase-like isoform X1 [Anopheles stephensi]XP_035909739.1 dopamine N-acetyltransferase-like isoform X1 [Anopheles stephensi]XP_035909740.1 dopamine N-acetyltransferase-like isoform X1 [Anopheles stephensi]XP_035909741.1 dopamine N-acetyltransferase-like isoform X1 [Anopheles stephensi]
MKVEIQNHVDHLPALNGITVSSAHDPLMLDETCLMLSNLLTRSNRMASKAPSIRDGTANVDAKSTEIDRQLSISVITEADTEDVLDLLKRFFFKDEPLNTYVQLGECKELEKYCTKSLGEHSSYKAVNSRGEIVGVIINGTIMKPQPGDEAPAKLADGCAHPKFRKIMALMDHVDEQFDIFELYPDIDRFLDCKILSVDTNYRGMGIAGLLTDRTLEYAARNDIKLIHVLCSSHFSARVMEKMDFTEVFRLPYADYRVDGEQVFEPEQPHVALRILTKRLDH